MSCKKIDLILLSLFLVLGCYHSMEISINQVVQGQQPFSTSQDFTGYGFTTDLINAIKGNITAAQSMYSSNQLLGIAQYLVQTLNKRNSNYKYSVYVYDNQTISAAEYVQNDDGQHLFWNQYGKYKLTYIIDFHSLCRTIGSSGAPSPFGEEVSSDDRDFLTETVKNSAVYRGDSVLDAANYIYTKLTAKYGSSYFKVNVSKPSSNMGFYECRTGQFWANFVNFTDRKWNYYIVRYYK